MSPVAAAEPLPAAVARLHRAILHTNPRPLRGRVERVVGTMIEARIGGVHVGELCRLERDAQLSHSSFLFDRVIQTSGDSASGHHAPGDPARQALLAEVVGVTGSMAFLTPLGSVTGLAAGAEVAPTGHGLNVPVGEALLGRVLDGLGRPLDRPDDPPLTVAEIPVEGWAPAPLARTAVHRALPVGIRVVDALLTCAEGQRIGIFGHAGTGKSSLIARIVRAAEADVFVVALVGERGREVGEFIERTLDQVSRRRCVVVAATSDRPALERVKAAQVATAIAEWFRERGSRVVLLVDSLTRLARAWREIGLAAGEPPTRRGFPPSVFAALPRLLERAGSSRRGTITAFYTVLLEGEISADPIAEDVKSILDGHLILSPKLAESDHHPAIDVLASRSRVMDAVTTAEHRDAAARLRQLLARHAEIELLVRVGEYQPGSDGLADEALGKIDAINAFLRQVANDASPFADTVGRLQALTR